jgi:hypothetical protein
MSKKISELSVLPSGSIDAPNDYLPIIHSGDNYRIPIEGFARTYVPNTFTQSQTVSASINVLPISGSNHAVLAREWSTTGSVISSNSDTGNPVALNDATFSGTYVNTVRLPYSMNTDDGTIIINVTDAVSNPNKYWVYNTLTNQFFSNRIMSTESVALPGCYGIFVKFGSTTGHALNDRWYLSIKDIPALKVMTNDQDGTPSVPFLVYKNGTLIYNKKPDGLLNPGFADNVGIMSNVYIDDTKVGGIGTQSQVSLNITGSYSFNSIGNYLRSQILNTSTGSLNGTLFGQFTVAGNYGKTTLSELQAGRFACEWWGGAGTTTTAYGVYISFQGINNNCTIQNGRGLYIAPLYHARILNGTYAIYQEGSNDWNYFRGKSGFGKLSPNSEIDVLGKITVSGSIVASGSISTQTFQMTSGAVNGYVLTSDANGNASWMPSGSGSSSGSVQYILLQRDTALTVNGSTFDNPQTIVYDTVTESTFDTSVYNTSTGIFTAPKDGVYSFSAAIQVVNASLNQSFRITVFNSKTGTRKGMQIYNPVATDSPSVVLPTFSIFLSSGSTASFGIENNSSSLNATTDSRFTWAEIRYN